MKNGGLHSEQVYFVKLDKPFLLSLWSGGEGAIKPLSLPKHGRRYDINNDESSRKFKVRTV